ncbi:MAG: helix-turn-helix transcriptional regulator [Treponema sp.]|jgi:DNA-binding XRE family transcriptional regulator|nr:helix-turn-helix transcriptional regulator [Treponema sp.]
MDYKNKIKELRNKMFLTQSEFAKELGVSIASIARWETGANEPTMKMKKKLNELFIKYKLVEE